MKEKIDPTREILSAEREMDGYWTHRSESYSQLNRKELQSEQKNVWEALLFEGAEHNRPLRILDVGAGPGFFSILCARRGHLVTAADMNAEMLRQAKENAGAAGVDVTFVQVGHRLPFAPESFDMIVSRNVTCPGVVPITALSSVLLPQPLSPTRHSISPEESVKEASATMRPAP